MSRGYLAVTVRALARVVAVSLGVALAATPADAAVTALTGGTIHDMRGGAPYVGTLVIDGTTISAVGANVTAPAGATVVDVSGLDIYPGLIDAQSTLGLTEIGAVRATVDSREIGDINPNVRAEVAFNPDSELLPVARINGITSAVSAPQGGLISGTSALMHLDGWTWEDMTLRAPLALHVAWPGRPGFSAFGGGGRGVDPEQAAKERTERVKKLKEAFQDARAYLTARAAMGQPGVPPHDFEPKWEAMIPALQGKLPVIVNCRWAEDIRDVVAWADAEGLKLILAGADDCEPVLDLLKAKQIPVILEPVFDFPPQRYMPYDTAYTLAGKLAAAGVPFCFSMSSDASNSRNLPYSAAMAVAYGCPAELALAGMTSTTARILGVADRVGSLAPGLCADLLVMKGTPLELRSEVRHVFLNGRDLPLVSRQTRLYDKYNSRPRAGGK